VAKENWRSASIQKILNGRGKKLRFSKILMLPERHIMYLNSLRSKGKDFDVQPSLSSHHIPIAISFLCWPANSSTAAQDRNELNHDEISHDSCGAVTSMHRRSIHIK
jgi:hypothetical protein